MMGHEHNIGRKIGAGLDKLPFRARLDVPGEQNCV